MLFIFSIRWFRVKSGVNEPIQIPSALEAGSSRIFVLDGRHLVIRDGNEQDSGAYELVLTNIAGRVSANFRIMVSCKFFSLINIFYSCLVSTFPKNLSPLLIVCRVCGPLPSHHFLNVFFLPCSFFDLFIMISISIIMISSFLIFSVQLLFVYSSPNSNLCRAV